MLFADFVHADSPEAVRRSFDRFVGQLRLPLGVEVLPTSLYRWGRRRPVLNVRIESDTWRTERAKWTKDNRLIVSDPGRFYDVHLAIEVNCYQSVLALSVYHETPPYVSRAKLIYAVGPETAALYLRRHEHFPRYLAQRAPDLRIWKHWAQVGSVRLPFGGLTLREVQRWLDVRISAVAGAINYSLLILNERARLYSRA
jgi:hypothetical protein